MKFDHIGVTTPDLAAGRLLLGESLGIGDWTAPFEDPLNDVYVQFGRCAEGFCFELVAPLSDRSPVRGVLERKINVLNHIAYLVDGLQAEASRLQAAGWVPIGPAQPAVAYGGRLIQFLVAPTRLLIELIEAPGHQHHFGACVASEKRNETV
jgi:methylmalonyl-CoA/ethylmalonyl-CoA epimerase